MRSFVVILALFLAACTGNKSEEAAGAGPPAAEAKKRPGEVLLDAEAQKNAAIVVEPVVSGTLAAAIHATGQLTVNEDETWSAGALHNGRVVSVHARVGDAVQTNQVLARIHTHDVHESRAAYKRAQAELARAEAAEAHARRLHARAERLFALKAMSQQEVEIATAELRNTQAAVQNAKTELERERLHLLEYLEIPLDETPGAGDFVPVKSPAAGIVIERKATAGAVVSPGQELFRVTTPSSLWMLAHVNEAEVAPLRVGQPVRVHVRAYPGRVFNGRILRLGESFDPTTRTLQVRVLVPNPGGLLKPEMYASAEIQQSSGRDALLVPTSAIQDLNGNRVVFVQTGAGRFEARHVQLGQPVDDRVEVAAGLKPGEKIVVRGSFVLKSQLLRGSIEEE